MSWKHRIFILIFCKWYLLWMNTDGNSRGHHQKLSLLDDAWFLPTTHKLLFLCEQQIGSHSPLSSAASPGNRERGGSSDPELCLSWVFGSIPPAARHGTEGGEIFNTRMGKTEDVSLSPNIGACFSCLIVIWRDSAAEERHLPTLQLEYTY